MYEIKELRIFILKIFLVLFFLLSSNELVLALDYKWPWPAGESWVYSRGWHDGPPWWGIDMYTSGRKQVLAGANAVITGICTSGTLSTNIYVTNEDGLQMRYLHFYKNQIESGVYINANIVQGQFLGVLKPDTWEDACGKTSQSANNAHLHWAFYNGIGKVVDGWTIQNYPNISIVLKDEGGNIIETKNPPSSTFLSSNQFTLRNQTVTGNVTYETTGSILLSGDGNGLVLSPSGDSVIRIIGH